ncbi:restriction endonuclease subunit S [Methanosarcina sp.]|uniref:restriction endonuclease subunit S n=1 Tax=Methanosarcina sp. TaxID=2213 RepID=UPI00298882A3|nr:restriction endonuclease subunit S [Methanosarcina sp.]MDW5555547.1 restriction endonuclease subunit S [Methanosarcina sp.]MDW5561103.1 restriction endonuclease subunit S [Methanosarcina sp.]
MSSANEGKILKSDIMNNWKSKKIIDLFDVKTGTTPSTKINEYWENGSINWFTPTDLSKSNGCIYINESERKITEKSLDELNLNLVPEKSIIISTRAPVGYVAVNKNPSTINQGCKVLVSRHSSIVPEFYYYVLKLNKYILESFSGGSTFKELSKKSLECIDLPFPPFSEQQKIAEILSTVDKAIEKSNAIISQAELLKRGLKKEFFDVSKIPPDWIFLKLSEICDFYDHLRVPVKKSDREKRRGKYPYYGAQGIIDWIDGFIFEGDYLLIAEDGENLRSKVLPIVYEVHDKFWVNNHAHILKPKKDYEISYLKYVLNFINIDKYINGSAQPKLTQDTAKKITVPLPPLPKQKKIASILSSIDENIETERKQLEQLKTLKKGLMQDLLTGRVRVEVGSNA